MKLRVLFCAIMVIGLIGCSTDGNFIEEPEEIQNASFQVIGEDLNSVFLFSYDGDSEMSITENLTQDIGVQPDYLTFRQLGNLISFYSFFQGAFSLDQKNIATEATSNFDNFFANGPDRSVVWGTNNLSNVFFGYFTPSNPRILAIQDVQLSSLESIDVNVDFDIDFLFQPIQHNGKLFLSYRDASGNFKLTFYDIASQTVGPILNFDSVSISILIDESGDLAVVKNGVNATIERYNPDSLSFLDSTELGFNSGFEPGPINGAVLSGDRLYYARPFIQPAIFPEGPAIFDLITQEDTAIDLSLIATQVEEELGASIIISTQKFSKSQNVFLLSYTVASQEIKGGIIQISPNGELVANITFPFQPTDILED